VGDEREGPGPADLAWGHVRQLVAACQDDREETTMRSKIVTADEAIALIRP
jgi:hypothetical protein